MTSKKTHEDTQVISQALQQFIETEFEKLKQEIAAAFAELNQS